MLACTSSPAARAESILAIIAGILAQLAVPAALR
jgi:hypothetical protein